MVQPQLTFHLSFWHGVWRVAFNGAFFGDYRSEHDALEGIAHAQRKLSAPAKIVRIKDPRPSA